MKSPQNNDAEIKAQRLKELSTISPDKRSLLKEIVTSAPDNITRDGRLNSYFNADTLYNENHKMPSIRIYASMAVVLVILLGGGVWLGLQNRSSQNTPTQASQISATGKVANTVNAISQQSQTESDVARTASVDTTSLNSADSQLEQMQESVNAKF